MKIRRQTLVLEPLMRQGRTEEAIENYRKALELNPATANATQMLKKLQGE